MAPIFISFIHEQEAVANAIKNILEAKLNLGPSAQGKRVFLSADQWQVYAGELWLDRIREELNSATVVVLLLSKNSVSRPWVNFEAGAAWLAKDKIIIPACFGGLPKNDLPKPYSAIQAVSLPDEAYYLVRSVHYFLTNKPEPPVHGLAAISPPPFSRDDPHMLALSKAISEIDSDSG